MRRLLEALEEEKKVRAALLEDERRSQGQQEFDSPFSSQPICPLLCSKRLFNVLGSQADFLLIMKLLLS